MGTLPAVHRRVIHHLYVAAGRRDNELHPGTGTLRSHLPDLHLAILIGNEGNGLTDRTAEACSRKVRIPMEGAVESLNAAMSAGILMYEVRRQRAAAGN